jgi:hypothetical protein
MKDFFISYTQADLARARWINSLLEAAGHSTIVQFKDLPPGSNFVIEMDEAVKQARQAIAILSPEYLASDYCQQEFAAVLGLDPKGKKRLLIPVRVRRCDPEGLLGPIVYIDLVGKDDETAKELLLSGVKGQTPARIEPPIDQLLHSHLTLQEYLAAKTLAERPDCESIFVRACFHPLLVEMETLPMALGRVRNPDQLYETLEQLPESLDYKLLRLRGRGLASAKVNPQTLQKLLHRLDDFITSEKTEEAHYFDAVVQAFAQARGEALDAVALGVVACLDSANNSSVRGNVAQVLGSFGSDRAVDALLKALLEDQESRVRWRAAEALGSIGSERAVDALLKALFEDQEAYVRGRAAKALGNIAAEKPERFAAGLMLALGNEKKSVRRKAAEVVGYYLNEPCLSELERLAATDESDEVKEAARAAVEKIKRKLRYFGANAADPPAN